MVKKDRYKKCSKEVVTYNNTIPRHTTTHVRYKYGILLKFYSETCHIQEKCTFSEQNKNNKAIKIQR